MRIYGETAVCLAEVLTGAYEIQFDNLEMLQDNHMSKYLPYLSVVDGLKES